MKISPTESVDLSRYEGPEEELEVLYGLPRDIQFCKKCNISNQQPMSSNEYVHNSGFKNHLFLDTLALVMPVILMI